MRGVLLTVAFVALSLALGASAFYGTALWERHNIQHAIAAQDHAELQRVVEFLNAQIAAAGKK